jgi:hypothetical protein
MKVDHKAKRMKMIIILLLIVFIYFSVSSVIHQNNIDLSSPAGWYNTGALYFSWLGNIGTGIWNAAGDLKGVIGNVVKGNSSNSGSESWKINIKK